MKRDVFLDHVRKIVMGERQQTYGQVEDNFNNIAMLWSVYCRRNFTAFDVAYMMILLKIARQMGTPDYLDGPVDIAGYAACVAEMIDETKGVNK